MYVAPDGSLIGVNSHPGNYGNLRGLGDDPGDDEGENDGDPMAAGMGAGGPPYGLGAFADLKQKVPQGRRPKLPTIFPTYASNQQNYPDRGVPVARARFDGRQTRYPGLGEAVRLQRVIAAGGNDGYSSGAAVHIIRRGR